MQGRGGGLSVRAPVQPSGVDRGRELRRGAAAALAEHRDRRLKLANGLLALALVLGVLQVLDFAQIGFPAGQGTGAIGGLVVDANTDAPVAGANVSIRGTSIVVTTEANGTFVISAAPVGRADMVVEKPGYLTTTFQIYVNPSPPTSDPVRVDTLRITPGQGSETQDLSSTRDFVLAVCIVIFVVGLVLNSMGLVAVIGRRRYRHAMAGCLGAVLSFGFFLGALCGAASVLLIMGARDEFQDRRSMFAPEADTPFSALTKDEDDDEEGGGAEGGTGEPVVAPEPPRDPSKPLYHDRGEGQDQMGGPKEGDGAAP